MDEREEFLAGLSRQAEPVMVIVAEQAPPGSKAEMKAMTELPNVQAAYLPGSLGMAEELGDAIASAIFPFLQGNTAPI